MGATRATEGAAEAEDALVAADEAAGRADVDALVAHLSTAVRGFTAAHDTLRAAMACVRLGDVLATGLGNLIAGRAWFARATRLLADEPPCLEQGWAAVGAMGCDVDDPQALLANAELALDRARRFGDVNLETKALADAGLAHVQCGRTAQGMALLDEAMALACAQADDAGVAAKSVCSFFTACYVACDFGRAGSWTAMLRKRGLIGTQPGPSLFLSSHCDSVQAALLIELGRWGEADALLRGAKTEFEAGMGAPSWHPDLGLADLRLRQGRLAEAEALLLGKDQAFHALLPAARLHLLRGDLALARATARRGLRAVRDDHLRAAELLVVLLDVELAAGDGPAATAAAADLVARTGAHEIAPLAARAAAARARALAFAGELDAAVATLEEAVDRLDPDQLPWLRATSLVQLADLRSRAGDHAGAVLDARAAAAVLAELDVVLPPAEAQVLARLAGAGGTAEGAAAHRPTAELVPVGPGKGWRIDVGPSRTYLPASKGLAYLADLLAHPGIERHALDLVDGAEGLGPVDRRALGDAGTMADGRARTAYRHRIEALRATAADAEADGRWDAAEAAQVELDALVAELGRAFGLGGRDRPAASMAERARLNVTRALRTAIARVTEVAPAAGSVLDRRVRTGTFCAFEPRPDDDVRWIVQRGPNGSPRD